MSFVHHYERNSVGRDFAVGDKFGRLILIEAHPGAKGVPVRWTMACECGKTVEKRKSDVVAGKTQSCGCLAAELNRARAKPEDLTGRRFGMLLAKEYIRSDAFKFPKWRCACDCGTITFVEPSELKKGSTISCGCFKSGVGKRNGVDIAGRKFGRLTAISKGIANNYGIYWSCRCECGEDSLALASDLIGGRRISCGCAALDKPGLLSLNRRLHSGVSGQKRRARVRGSAGAFTKLEIDNLYALQKGKCANCRDPLRIRFHRDHKMPLALGGSNDIGNIELLCRSCNARKSAKHPLTWAAMNGRLL